MLRAFHRPFVTSSSSWLVGMLLLELAGVSGSPRAWAGEPDQEQPVCIKMVGDKLVAVPGDCPDEFAESLKKSGEKAGANQKSGSRNATQKRSTSESYDTASNTQGNPRIVSGTSPGVARPVDAAELQQVRASLRAMAKGADEQLALQDFETFVGRGTVVVEPTAVVYLDKKEDARVRWIAGRALGRIYSRASVDALIRGMKDPVPLVRIAAVRGAQELGDRRMLPALEAALDDKAAVVRADVLDTLATLGTRDQVPAIIRQLNAPRNFNRGKGIFVRPHAADALGKLGGPEAIQALIETVHDRDPDTRAAARSALLTLTQRSAPPPGPGSEQERWQKWWNEQGR